MDRWAAALVLSALVVVVAPRVAVYPYEPIVATGSFALFVAVFFGWCFVLLRMSFATVRWSQWLAGAVMAIAWVLLLSYGADVAQQLYAPVHNDRCVPSDPHDPDCGSSGWGV